MSTNRILIALMLAVWVLIVARAIINAKDTDAFVITVGQEEVTAFAKQKLAEIQDQSIATNTELCGIIFEDSAGNLGSSPIKEGDLESCDIQYFDEPGMAPVASYHTHAAYSDEYDSEVPSLLDFASDTDSGMDGYVATPGGRFWIVDATQGHVRQICGEGCLQSDPGYVPCRSDKLEETYSFAALRTRYEDGSWRC